MGELSLGSPSVAISVGYAGAAVTGGFYCVGTGLVSTGCFAFKRQAGRLTSIRRRQAVGHCFERWSGWLYCSVDSGSRAAKTTRWAVANRKRASLSTNPLSSKHSGGSAPSPLPSRTQAPRGAHTSAFLKDSSPLRISLTLHAPPSTSASRVGSLPAPS